MSDEHDVVVAERIERRDWEFAEDAGVAVETRADGRLTLTGYAVRYNTLSVDLGGFRETILPGAFDKVLNRQRGKQDVVALFNHDPNQLLGRTSSGTLELTSDEKGLRYSVVLPNTELGRSIAELTARSDLRGSSFAFTVDAKGEQWAPGDDGKPRRSIREVSGLFDVSVVTHPAYSSSSTAIARRSMGEWLQSQAEERCECQEVHAEEKAEASTVDPKAISIRLKAAILRTFLRGFCPTGKGGGIDNSCGGGGDGGDGGGGGGAPKGDVNPGSLSVESHKPSNPLEGKWKVGEKTFASKKDAATYLKTAKEEAKEPDVTLDSWSAKDGNKKDVWAEVHVPGYTKMAAAEKQQVVKDITTNLVLSRPTKTLSEKWADSAKAWEAISHSPLN